MRYLIKYDFAKFQPSWNRGLASRLGDNNEGVIVAAETPKAAIETFNASLLAGERFNPFYLKVGPVLADYKPFRTI